MITCNSGNDCLIYRLQPSMATVDMIVLIIERMILFQIEFLGDSTRIFGIFG